MARCGCSADCLCVLTGSNCIKVSGAGSVTSPYLVEPIIDVVAPNQLVCGPNGLLVPDGGVDTADTACISLSGVGSALDPLKADPNISADVCNLMECVAAGPSAGLRALLTTADSDCIDLTGCGTPGDPLVASPHISLDPGNLLECRGTGLFVPPGTPAGIDFRATLQHIGFVPTIIPPYAGGFPGTVSTITYDTVFENVGPIVVLGDALIIPVGGAGVYLIAATHPAWSLAPFVVGSTMCRLVITVNGLGIGQTGQVKPPNPATATAFNTPYLEVTKTQTLLVGDVVRIEFWVEDYSGAPFAGATLDTGPALPPFAGGDAPFFQITRLGV